MRGKTTTSAADGHGPVLQARGLEVAYKTRRGQPARAVDYVDLDLDHAEILALVGESGCGKTSLARALLGLAAPTAGDVLFEGSPLEYRARQLTRYRRRVQLTLQDATGALHPRQTVYQSVAEGLRIHKIGQRGDSRSETERVALALSRAGLRPPERYFSKYPNELSGGQHQRVVLAGALALEPDVLIADEPVSSLDASIRGEVLALLLRLRDELGLTILIVTHDLGLAWNIADRIAVMYLGRIVEIGTTEQVLGSPKHPYTQALLSVVPETSRTQPIVLKGETPDPQHIPAGCRFHPRCPAYGDGTAARHGVDSSCTKRPLPALSATGPHRSACWLEQAKNPTSATSNQSASRAPDLAGEADARA